MAGDLLFKDVALLINGNGPDGSAFIADASVQANAVSSSGVVITTAESLFGGSSMAFSGTSVLNIPDSALWDFGTGDFSIEVAFRFSSISGVVTLLGNFPGWVVQYRPDVGGITFGLGNAKLKTSAFTPSLSTWYRISIRRSSGMMETWVGDYPLDAATAVGDDLSGSGAPLAVGYLNYYGVYLQPLSGHMAHLRITRAARVFGSAVSAPWPEYASQISGVVRDTSNTPCARQVRAHRRDTGVLVGSVTSDAVTGAYTINSLYVGEHTVQFIPADGEALNALVLDRVTGV